MRRKRIVVGITGASGAVYGIELLKSLRELGIESHLILSEYAEKNIGYETDLTPNQVRKLADQVYDFKDQTQALASGSFLTEGMVIVPCSVKTLSGVANCTANNLLLRAADVHLKERRKLVLVFRETPLHLGHIRLMAQATEAGGIILPPVPGFYVKPKSIEDIIFHTVGKILDSLGIDQELFPRWEGG